MTGFGRGRGEPPKNARQYLQQAARLADRDPQAALAQLRKAIALKPDAAEAHLQVARLLMRLGNLEAALNSFYQALACDSSLSAARLGLAELLLHIGRPAEALGHARVAGKDAHLLAGIALQQLGRRGEAEAEYRQVLALQPRCAEAWCNLGLLAREQGDPEAAVALYAEAIACRPDFPEALINQGLALEALGRYTEAAAAHRRALALQPDDQIALAGLASVLEKQDDCEGAAQVIVRAATSEHPKVLLVEASLGLRHSDPRAARRRLEAALAVNRYSDSDRALVLFALARLADATGDPAAAMAAAAEGHTLRRTRFDPEAFEAEIAAQRALFANPLPPTALRPGAQRLVFIVGMPRSGTSLVEQILASHPEFAAGGERPEIPALIKSFPGRYPANLALLDAAQLAALAETYLAKLAAVAPEAKYVSDKLPGNGLHLGLIARLLPGARVVYCRRDPLDTCLSCYLHDFEGNHPYIADLAHLGLVCRTYGQLMSHWQSVLPLPIFELVYEELVAEPERVVRNLLAFVGLDWRTGTLEFWRQKRPVLTASYAQVREPIHRRSVGRARAYAAWLAPLRAALAKK